MENTSTSSDLELFYMQYKEETGANFPVEDGAPIDTLKEEYKDCTNCDRCRTRNKVVFGFGNYNPTFMFVGGGPSLYDSDIGIPFSDKPGKKVQGIYEYLNKKKKCTVWYTNIVLCSPSSLDENSVDSCKARFRKEIEIINPKNIILLGEEVGAYLGVKGKLKKHIIEFDKNYNVYVVTSLHDLFYKRDEVVKDLVKELDFVMRQVENEDI